MAAPSVYQLINGTYVTIYDRAGDPAGVTYLATQEAGSVAAAMATPATLTQAAQLGVLFYQATPTTFDAMYAANNDTQFIEALYNNLGGSNADSAGLTYWLGQLAAAESSGTYANTETARAAIAGEVALDLLTFNAATSSLTGSDLAAATARAAEYANKVAASQSLASTGNTAFNPAAANLSDSAYAGELVIISNITSDPATLAAANVAIAAANAANNPALLTTIVATSTDTGGASTLNFLDGSAPTGPQNSLVGDHDIVTVDFTPVTGDLTVAFQNDSLANGALINLGAATTTLTIGESNVGAHINDTINVAVGAAATNVGVYDITLGNQNDHINLGGHSTGDTLTFMQPYNLITHPPLLTHDNLDIITNVNLPNDTFNFSVSGFNGTVNPTGNPAGNPAASVFTQLLTAEGPGSFAKPVAAGDTVQADFWGGGGPLLPPINNTGVVFGGTNFIVDTNPNTGSIGTPVTAGTLAFQLAVSPVKVSAGYTTGVFLIAYQAGSDVHIAEASISHGSSLPGSTAAGDLDPFSVHDIIDLVGQSVSTLTPATVSHLVHFTA
jgi:Domain of unknown function (DUF4214)